MRPTIRLVASDINQTLANQADELTPYTVEVLRALLAHGVSVLLVTGLNPWPARRFVQAIGYGARAISLNGVFLLEDDAFHEGRYADPEVVRAAAELIAAQDFVPLIYGADGVTRYLPIGFNLPTVAALIESRAYQPYCAVETLAALFDVRPVQASVATEDQAAAQALACALEAALGEHAYVIFQPQSPPQPTWVEVNHPRARKDVALLDMAARWGIQPEEILYFGDSLNDLPVFEAIPHAVAVDNARPEVKARAWRETASNDADGVARFLAEWFEL